MQLALILTTDRLHAEHTAPACSTDVGQKERISPAGKLCYVLRLAPRHDVSPRQGSQRLRPWSAVMHPPRLASSTVAALEQPMVLGRDQRREPSLKRLTAS